MIPGLRVSELAGERSDKELRLLPLNKKAALVSQGGFDDRRAWRLETAATDYFFFAARFSMIAAWAAARRATGTR